MRPKIGSPEWLKIVSEELFSQNEFNRERYPDAKHRKYRGAVTQRMIRSILKKLGYNVSNPNVFLEGLESIELDLLILKPGIPDNKLVYHPNEVKKVIEIKTWGVFGKDSLEKVKNDMAAVKRICSTLSCHVITALLSPTYKYRLTNENTGAEVSAIFWNHGVRNKQRVVEYNADWHKNLLTS